MLALFAVGCDSKDVPPRAVAASITPVVSVPPDAAVPVPVVDATPVIAATPDGGCAVKAAAPDDGAATTAVNGEQLTLRAARFADLPAWADDAHAEAIPSFLRSCAVLDKLDDDDDIAVVHYAGKAKAWRAACAAAQDVPKGDDAAARAFFEAAFTPYQAEGKDGPDGKMTSYNVQSARGSFTRHGAYQHPIYARPPELVSVEHCDDGQRGKRSWGKLDADGKLVPYFTRAEIRQGALDGRGLELMYLDDVVDALFMHIEGSGKVALDDGTERWVEFSGKNGRGYKGVGKLLRESGELQKGEGTMQGIRAWFVAHPERTDEIIDQNSSMVFFALSEQPGAVGSQGVILTPRRSMAIDRSFIAQSTPIWVDTRAPVPGEAHEQPWRHLLIAQDTGGGILGPVRGDLYMGDDADAAEISGRMGGRGRYWLLLPRELDVPTSAN